MYLRAAQLTIGTIKNKTKKKTITILRAATGDGKILVFVRKARKKNSKPKHHRNPDFIVYTLTTCRPRACNATGDNSTGVYLWRCRLAVCLCVTRHGRRVCSGFYVINRWLRIVLLSPLLWFKCFMENRRRRNLVEQYPRVCPRLLNRNALAAPSTEDNSEFVWKKKIIK